MTWDTASKIALATLPVLAAVAQFLRISFGRRAQLKRDIELLAYLPPGSSAHDCLLKHVDKSLRHLIIERRRRILDPAGLGLTLAYLAVAALMAAQALRGEGWGWWVGTSFFVFVGLGGLVDTFTNDEQADSGSPSATDDIED